MNIRYLIISIITITLGAIIAFLPEKKYTGELTPEKLLTAINDNSRYISSDQIAHRLIESDPSVLLIDVRDTASFKQYSLPSATNIPLDSLLSPSWAGFLDQDFVTKVFYSNGSVYAAQAWTLATRLGYKNVYILKGGLNNWVETILRPQAPNSSDASDEFDLYESRVAASQFFGGASNSAATSSASAPKKVIKKKKRKKGAQGGC